MQLDLATAYSRVGDVQGNPQLSHLGQPKAAVESYTKALAIAEHLRSSPAVLELMADTQNKLGAVYFWGLGRASDGVNHVRSAIALADAIPKTGRPAFALRAFTRGTLGDFLTYDDPVAALEPLRQSVEISREWASAQRDALLLTAPNWDQDSRFHLALEVSRLGAAEQESGDLPQAMNHFAEALRLMEQFLLAQPDNNILRRERAMYYERLAWVTGHPQYFNLGDREQALEWMRKYVPEMEALSRADPADLRARSDLCEALGELGAISGESDAAGAAKVYRRSLNLNASVLEETPEDSRMAFVQAFNQVGFAGVLDNLGRRLEALDQLNAAVELLEKLVREHAREARFAEYLGLTLRTRGEEYLRLGKTQTAAKDLDASRSILERLYAQNPRKLVRLRDLADCYQAVGDLHASRAEWREAHAGYQQSLRLWERWMGVGTSSVYDRQRRELALSRVHRATGMITVP